MKKTAQEPKVTDNPLYHDTWMLLRKYRDVVWSLELSVQQVRRQFQIEYGSFSSSARLSFDEYPHSTELRASIAI